MSTSPTPSKPPLFNAIQGVVFLVQVALLVATANIAASVKQTSQPAPLTPEQRAKDEVAYSAAYMKAMAAEAQKLHDESAPEPTPTPTPLTPQELTTAQAKQIAASLLIYASDYDENLPPPGQEVEPLLLPYLKTQTEFEPVAGDTGQGRPFVYTYSKSKMPSDPHSTELGYKRGPGGRAVLWADGHVLWQDTP